MYKYKNIINSAFGRVQVSIDNHRSENVDAKGKKMQIIKTLDCRINKVEIFQGFFVLNLISFINKHPFLHLSIFNKENGKVKHLLSYNVVVAIHHT